MTKSRKFQNPYPGLKPFSYPEAHNFFGRTKILSQLVFRLKESQALYLVGPSGSGKSSLVFAGLLPALEEGVMRGAAEFWRYVIFRPSVDPIGNLADAIYEAYQNKSDYNVWNRMLADSEVDISKSEFTNLARNNPPKFLEHLKKFQEKTGGKNESLLIVIDQFEELFSEVTVKALSVDSSEKTYFNTVRDFSRLLKDIRRETYVKNYLVATMRTDSIVECEDHSSLMTDISDNLFLVHKLSEREYKEIIIKPADNVGVYVEDAVETNESKSLVDKLIDDVKSEDHQYREHRQTRLPDQLPLLQHALALLWKSRGLDKKADDISNLDYEKLREFVAEQKSRNLNKITDDESSSELPKESSQEAEKTNLSRLLNDKLEIIYSELILSVEEKIKEKSDNFHVKNAKNLIRKFFICLIDMNPRSKRGIRRSLSISELINDLDIQTYEECDFLENVIKMFSREKSKVATSQDNNSFMDLGRNRYLIITKSGKVQSEWNSIIRDSFGSVRNENLDEVPEYRVEVSHETLLRHWDRLKLWYNEEQNLISEANYLYETIKNDKDVLTPAQTKRFENWLDRLKNLECHKPNWFDRHKPFIVDDRMIANSTNLKGFDLKNLFDSTIGKSREEIDKEERRQQELVEKESNIQKQKLIFARLVAFGILVCFTSFWIFKTNETAEKIYENAETQQVYEIFARGSDELSHLENLSDVPRIQRNFISRSRADYIRGTFLRNAKVKPIESSETGTKVTFPLVPHPKNELDTFYFLTHENKNIGIVNSKTNELEFGFKNVEGSNLAHISFSQSSSQNIFAIDWLGRVAFPGQEETSNFLNIDDSRYDVLPSNIDIYWKNEVSPVIISAHNSREIGSGRAHCVIIYTQSISTECIEVLVATEIPSGTPVKVSFFESKSDSINAFIQSPSQQVVINLDSKTLDIKSKEVFEFSKLDIQAPIFGHRTRKHVDQFDNVLFHTDTESPIEDIVDYQLQSGERGITTVSEICINKFCNIPVQLIGIKKLNEVEIAQKRHSQSVISSEMTVVVKADDFTFGSHYSEFDDKDPSYKRINNYLYYSNDAKISVVELIAQNGSFFDYCKDEKSKACLNSELTNWGLVQDDILNLIAGSQLENYNIQYTESKSTPRKFAISHDGYRLATIWQSENVDLADLISITHLSRSKGNYKAEQTILNDPKCLTFSDVQFDFAKKNEKMGDDRYLALRCETPKDGKSGFVTYFDTSGKAKIVGRLPTLTSTRFVPFDKDGSFIISKTTNNRETNSQNNNESILKLLSKTSEFVDVLFRRNPGAIGFRNEFDNFQDIGGILAAIERSEFGGTSWYINLDDPSEYENVVDASQPNQNELDHYLLMDKSYELESNKCYEYFITKKHSLNRLVHLGCKPISSERLEKYKWIQSDRALDKSDLLRWMVHPSNETEGILRINRNCYFDYLTNSQGIKISTETGCKLAKGKKRRGRLLERVTENVPYFATVPNSSEGPYAFIDRDYKEEGIKGRLVCFSNVINSIESAELDKCYQVPSEKLAVNFSNDSTKALIIMSLTGSESEIYQINLTTECDYSFGESIRESKCVSEVLDYHGQAGDIVHLNYLNVGDGRKFILTVSNSGLATIREEVSKNGNNVEFKPYYSTSIAPEISNVLDASDFAVSYISDSNSLVINSVHSAWKVEGLGDKPLKVEYFLRRVEFPGLWE